jgi:hypothetical protein
MPRPTKELRKLSCILTDAECVKCSQQLTDEMDAIDREESDLAEYKKGYGFRIEQITGRMNELRTKIGTGREFRDVECSIEWDFTKKKKIVTRKDTKEVVSTTPISEEECQEELKLKDAAKKPIEKKEKVEKE